eukprot:RCo039385
MGLTCCKSAGDEPHDAGAQSAVGAESKGTPTKNATAEKPVGASPNSKPTGGESKGSSPTVGGPAKPTPQSPQQTVEITINDPTRAEVASPQVNLGAAQPAGSPLSAGSGGKPLEQAPAKPTPQSPQQTVEITINDPTRAEVASPQVNLGAAQPAGSP